MKSQDSIIEIALLPEQAVDKEWIDRKLAQHLNRSIDNLPYYRISHRSIDARKKPILIKFKIQIIDSEDRSIEEFKNPDYKNVSNAEEVIVIGSGPAGLFAALKLIELGKKPLVFERGKDVRSRRRDLAQIAKEQIVNEESNYCFGEGGAGTYSDGKLYTRSKKRGDVKRILHLLVAHGAKTDILIDAHPHIGTNKLPAIISTIRETILGCGGELHFNSKMTDIILDGDQIKGCVINETVKVKANKLILATGHSARDIFQLLHQKGIEIEAKPFALGVRIEHPQLLIDQIQYKCKSRSEYLPPASYSLVHQAGDRGVYSFCMCPGGIIAPCATKQDEIVTNGWSPSKRNQLTANSGIVVGLTLGDFKSDSPLSGMEFQREIEHKAWILGGKTQKAPAQRMVDFIEGRVSKDLPNSSYIPGVTSTDLKEVLPNFISKAIKTGLSQFNNKMRGYLTNEAVLLAPESRTSSPVRIPRDKDSLEHVRIKGLYPCGEGAGYAGGIVSAAIDGEKCAEQCQ